MRVLYSFNKTGYEAQFWEREIAAASTADTTFIPFNHGPYLNPSEYIRAQLLDDLYYRRDPRLASMYKDFLSILRAERIDALVVDNCPPYHPEFLLSIEQFKVLRIADGPISAYDRDFAYAHAYDHIVYHSPAYSRDLTMAAKLEYVGAVRSSLWPLALFDANFDTSKTEATLLSGHRDIDVLFIGAQHVEKMPFLAQVKKALGRRCRMHGLTSLKRNLYFNVRFGFPGWVTPIDARQYASLYQRAKIGFNLHNRGKFTVGNFRLFELAGNGVMQLSDGGEYLNSFFAPGEEVVSYEGADELIEKIDYFLSHEDERREIALNAYRRVMREHRLRTRMVQLSEIIAAGMVQAREVIDRRASIRGALEAKGQ